MYRINDYDHVSISLPDGALRSTSLSCHVIAKAGDTLALDPDEQESITWLPDRIPGAFLVFPRNGALLALKGDLIYRGARGDLRFKVTDPQRIDRRRSSRLRIRLPVSVRVAGADDVVEASTVDVSADGLLIDCRSLVTEVGQRLTIELRLPREDDPIKAMSTVRRVSDGQFAVEFDSSAKAQRRRVATLVCTRNRATLRRRETPAEDDADF
jgi:hypothetical protein